MLRKKPLRTDQLPYKVGGVVKAAENLVEVSAAFTIPPTLYGCWDTRADTELYSACKQNTNIVADAPFTGERGYKGRKQSKRQRSHLYEQIIYDHTQRISMHEHRCAYLRTIKSPIIKGITKELKEAVRERTKRERERKRNKTEKAPAERSSTNTYPRDIGEHLLAENIGVGLCTPYGCNGSEN